MNIDINNLSPYQRWCLERGYPLSPAISEELENGNSEDQHWREYTDQRHEIELMEQVEGFYVNN